MGLLSGLLDEVREGLREVAGRHELRVCQHPEEVVQEEDEPAPDHGAVWGGGFITIIIKRA